MNDAPLETSTPEEKKTASAGTWKEFIRFVFIVAIIVIPVRFFVAQPFVVSGASMEPSYETGDYLIIDELTYRFRPPSRGEVVVVRSPIEKRYLIKRVIGLPGETVTLSGERVLIERPGEEDPTPVSETYLTFRSNERGRSVELSAGEYFLMGDNRPSSLDSRFWGPLPRDHIVGRVLIRLWPLRALGVFPAFPRG